MEQQLDRVGKVGGEGLIAELVRTEKEGARLSRDEIVATVFLLLFAGRETTEAPHQRIGLRAREKSRAA